MTKTTLQLESVQKVIGLEELDSTQTLARALARSEGHATLILACYQTGAFDKNGNPFPATEGGVYFTLILKPSKELDLQALTRAAAHSVADTLKNVFELGTKITPDGDVLVWDKSTRKYKKIAGILAEENETGAYLLGVGIFLNNPLPTAYKDTCVSLKKIIGTDTSKELFLDDVLTNFWKEYAFL